MTTPLINTTYRLANPSYRAPRITRRLLRRVALLAATSIASAIFCVQSNARAAAIAPITSHTSPSYRAGVNPHVLFVSDEKYDQLGMEKLAEMAAFARHNEECPVVPREWSAAFIVLLLANPPSEPQVEFEEKKLLALRRKIGKQNWCALYRVEMNEAYLVYRFMTRQ